MAYVQIAVVILIALIILGIIMAFFIDLNKDASFHISRQRRMRPPLQVLRPRNRRPRGGIQSVQKPIRRPQGHPKRR